MWDHFQDVEITPELKLNQTKFNCTVQFAPTLNWSSSQLNSPYQLLHSANDVKHWKRSCVTVFNHHVSLLFRSAGVRKVPPKKEQSWKRPKMPKWRCLSRSMCCPPCGFSTMECTNLRGHASGTHPSRYCQEEIVWGMCMVCRCSFKSRCEIS